MHTILLRPTTPFKMGSPDAYSVTTLSAVIPLLGEGKNTTLDWILSETNSYAHYSKGAKSVWGMRVAQAGHATSRAASLALEKEREGVAKLRKAGLATVRLPNAVRRGDLLAVKALLDKGADRTQKTPEGLDLATYALKLGHQSIHDELIHAGDRGDLPPAGADSSNDG